MENLTNIEIQALNTRRYQDLDNTISEDPRKHYQKVIQEFFFEIYSRDDQENSESEPEKNPPFNNYSEIPDANNFGYNYEFDLPNGPLLNPPDSMIDSLLDKIHNGVTFHDIESVLFFILFLRFFILVLRYNLKTSFYITCISIVAGYFWYKHLIDLISLYREVLVKIPFLHKLGSNMILARVARKQELLTEFKLNEDAHWYNPGKVLYYAFIQGITHIDPQTGFKYYIDPISMIISKLPDSIQANVLLSYYKLYKIIIPKAFQIISNYYNQVSSLIAYILITRLGKRYCPYLIRWHWTFLIIISLFERFFVFFINRVQYFQTSVLVPQKEALKHLANVNLTFYSELTEYQIVDLEIQFLELLVICVVVTHLSFVFFALFHAICGQYFYIPFLVENTELHVGPRPKNSIYSTGQTAWQDPEEQEKALDRLIPKLWYGWFGRGTKNKWNLSFRFKKIVKKAIKIIKKIF